MNAVKDKDGLEARERVATFCRCSLTVPVLCLIILLALGLRLWGLAEESAFYDEVASFRHIRTEGLMNYLNAVRSTDPPMTPLYFTLQYFWTRVAGVSLYPLRLLSVGFGVACVPLVFILGKMIYGAAGGLCAAFLCSVSLAQIYYSQEVRPYALVLFLALLSALGLLLAMYRGRRVGWVLNVTANGLLLWTHLFTGLFLLAQGCWLLFVSLYPLRWKRVVYWTLPHVPFLILLFFWILSIDHENLAAAAEWRHEVQHNYFPFLGDFLLFTGAGVPMFRDVPGFGGWSMGAIMWRFSLVIVMLTGLFGLMRLRSSQATASALITERPVGVMSFLIFMAGLPSLVLFLVSAFIYTCHASRYVLFSSVFFLVLLAGAVALAPRKWMAWALVIVMALVYGVNIRVHERPLRAEFAAVPDYLVGEMESDGERIIIYIQEEAPSLWCNGRPELGTRPIVGAYSMEIVPEMLLAPKERDVPEWLIIIPPNHMHPHVAGLEEALLARGETLQKRTFGFVRPVHVYRLDPAATDGMTGQGM